MNPEKDLPYNLRNNPQEDHPEDHPEEDHPESHPEEPLEEPQQPSNELLELLGLKSPTKSLGPATLAEQHLINLHQKVKALEENHLQWPERLLELRSIDREGARALEKYFEDLMKDFGKLQRWLEKCVVKQRKLTEKREGWMGGRAVEEAVDEAAKEKVEGGEIVDVKGKLLVWDDLYFP